MDVEVVHDEVPLGGRRVARHGVPRVRYEVGFGARRSTRWAEHLTAGDVEVDDERAGAVADVFELPSGDLARPRRWGWREPLERLHARHLVGAHGALASLGTITCCAI